MPPIGNRRPPASDAPQQPIVVAPPCRAAVWAIVLATSPYLSSTGAVTIAAKSGFGRSPPDNTVEVVCDNYIPTFIGVTCCGRATAAAASACYGHALRTWREHVRAYDGRKSISWFRCRRLDNDLRRPHAGRLSCSAGVSPYHADQEDPSPSRNSARVPLWADGKGCS
jgi:hypothetical protein